MMGMPRTSTVVLAALLGGVIKFCLVCLVCGLLLLYLALVCFLCVCFPFVFSYAVEFFLIFLLSMSSGEIGKDAIPFHGCCRWSSFVPFVLCVLRDGKSTGKLTTSTIAAVFKIYNVAMCCLFPLLSLVFFCPICIVCSPC